MIFDADSMVSLAADFVFWMFFGGGRMFEFGLWESLNMSLHWAMAGVHYHYTKIQQNKT